MLGRKRRRREVEETGAGLLPPITGEQPPPGDLVQRGADEQGISAAGSGASADKSVNHPWVEAPVAPAIGRQSAAEQERRPVRPLPENTYPPGLFREEEPAAVHEYDYEDDIPTRGR